MVGDVVDESVIIGSTWSIIRLRLERGYALLSEIDVGEGGSDIYWRSTRCTRESIRCDDHIGACRDIPAHTRREHLSRARRARIESTGICEGDSTSENTPRRLHIRCTHSSTRRLWESDRLS